LDDESKDTTDQYERYSSSHCFDTTTTNFSAGQNAIRRGVQPDNNISGPAPNMGMPVYYAPPVETELRNNGGEFLEPPILTTPQRSYLFSPFTYGGIEVEGARKSTLVS